VDGLTLVLILGGGVLAGIINTVAGGGSIITLPLLIFSGLPASVANGTNRVAILFQTGSAVAGFRKHGFTVGRGTWLLLIPSLLGAFVGARLAVSLDETTLRRVIGAVLILMLVPLFRRTRPGKEAGPVTPPLRAWVWPVYFLIGAYGGFLQVGVGFLYLSLLVGAHAMNLVKANLIKTFLVLGYTILTLVVYGRAGQIAIVPGLVLAAGMAWGGWLGAKLAVEKGERWIRVLLVVAILAASARLLGFFG
jgi:uncharacterized membrane protein YfcA